MKQDEPFLLTLGLRGLNEWLSIADGCGFYFELEDCKGKKWERVFPNIGQSNPNPPMNLHHIDEFSVRDDVFIRHFSVRPFAMRYTLPGGFDFCVLQKTDCMFFEVFTPYPLIFKSVGKQVLLENGIIQIGKRTFVKGLSFNSGLKGEISFVVSTGKSLLQKQKTRTEKLQKEMESLPQQPWASGVTLNLIRSDALKNKFYVPINKIWIDFFEKLLNISNRENILIFPWDGSFSSLILGHCFPEMAWKNMMSIFEAIMPDGRLPQIRVGKDYLSNRTNPPVWFLTIDELYKIAPKVEFMRELIPKLIKNYKWFCKNRQNSEESGMPYTFSWGTDDSSPDSLEQTRGRIGAMMESGLDDSPIFDEMELCGKLLDFACIDLSCLMYRACEVLCGWAEQTEFADLFNPSDIKVLKVDRENFRKAVHTFFDDKNGIANSYIIRNGKKVFASELTPLSFYPLLTEGLSQTEIDILVKLYYSEHFMKKDNDSVFLPSVSFLSKTFNGDGDYWRGRVWPPMVYLTGQGFKRYSIEVYNDIRRRANRMIMDEWHRHGHVHENYSGTTGQGEPQVGIYARSCPLYSWGGLLGII